MQIDELARTAGLTVLVPGPTPDLAVERIGAGDHISRLLNEAAAHTLLVTVLAGTPLLRVAELMGAPAVCLAGGRAPEPAFLREARARGVAVLAAAWPAEETCRRVSACLGTGTPPKSA